MSAQETDRDITLKFTQSQMDIQIERIAALEAEVERLTGALEGERFASRNGPSLSEAAIHAIREMLNANDVPLAAFIDDHVGNAIVQRNQARAELAAIRSKALSSLAEIDADLGKEGGT